jgi:hypothetical protein
MQTPQFSKRHTWASQTTVEKIALNSLKEMVPGLSLNFSILPDELLTSMVYMGVELTMCIGI